MSNARAENYEELQLCYKIACNELEIANNEKGTLELRNKELESLTAKYKDTVEKQKELINLIKKSTGNSNNQEVQELKNKVAESEKKLKSQELTSIQLRIELDNCKNELLRQKADSELTIKVFSRERETLIKANKEKQDALQKESEEVRKLVNVLRNAPHQQTKEMKDVLETEDKYLKEQKSEDRNELIKLKTQCNNLSAKLKQSETAFKKLEEEKRILIREFNELRINTDVQVSKQCVFCLNEMTASESEFNQLPRCTKCNTVGHVHCMAKWFETKLECPLCHVDTGEMVNVERIIKVTASKLMPTRTVYQ